MDVSEDASQETAGSVDDVIGTVYAIMWGILIGAVYSMMRRSTDTKDINNTSHK